MCRPVPSRWTIVFWASPERDGRRCPCTRAGLPSFIRHFTSPCPAPAPKSFVPPPALFAVVPSLYFSGAVERLRHFCYLFFFYGTQSPKSSLSVGLFCLPLSREQAQGPGPDRRRMPTAFFLFLIFLGTPNVDRSPTGADGTTGGRIADRHTQARGHNLQTAKTRRGRGGGGRGQTSDNGPDYSQGAEMQISALSPAE